MDKIYATLIEKGLKTIDEVPEVIREKVQAVLDARAEDETPTA